jgi:hypothetical protein
MGDLAQPPGNPFSVIHIKHMVEDHQYDGQPADVIQIMFSNTYPTFATKINIIVEKWGMLYHQPDLTIQQRFCQL